VTAMAMTAATMTAMMMLNSFQWIHLKYTKAIFVLYILPAMECANEMLFLENPSKIEHRVFFLQIVYLR
jgi:hypothetical protein